MTDTSASHAFGKEALPTPDQAYATMLADYRELKFKTPAEERGAKAVALAKSAATAIVDRAAPMRSADLLLGALETVPAIDRSQVYAAIVTRATGHALDTYYPEAATWYDRVYMNTEKNGQDWQRTIWQRERQNLKTIPASGITSDEKALAASFVMTNPVLGRIAAQAPWSALDARYSCAGLVPESRRNDFLDRQVFRNHTFSAVMVACKPLADHYRAEAVREFGYTGAEPKSFAAPTAQP
jgi:hypothetical protein